MAARRSRPRGVCLALTHVLSVDLTGEPSYAEATQQSLAGRFHVEPRGLVELAGRGSAEAYFLLGPVNDLQ